VVGTGSGRVGAHRWACGRAGPGGEGLELWRSSQSGRRRARGAGGRGTPYNMRGSSGRAPGVFVAGAPVPAIIFPGV
jgi:hypothetical protein